MARLPKLVKGMTIVGVPEPSHCDFCSTKKGKTSSCGKKWDTRVARKLAIMNTDVLGPVQKTTYFCPAIGQFFPAMDVVTNGKQGRASGEVGALANLRRQTSDAVLTRDSVILVQRVH